MIFQRSGKRISFIHSASLHTSPFFLQTRNLVRTRYTSQADSQREKDYQRTHNDLYRMQLDNVDAYHKSNRENMLRVYHSYLENTPGSKKALRELCDQISPKTGKSDVKNAA